MAVSSSQACSQRMWWELESCAVIDLDVDEPGGRVEYVGLVDMPDAGVASSSPTRQQCDEVSQNNSKSGSCAQQDKQTTRMLPMTSESGRVIDLCAEDVPDIPVLDAPLVNNGRVDSNQLSVVSAKHIFKTPVTRRHEENLPWSTAETANQSGAEPWQRH